MSTLAVNAVTDANGGNTATINSMTPTADSLQGFRNRIINGDMRIDQRNAGASVTNGATFAYTLDRWNYFATQASKFTIQQNAGSVTPPVGFTNYLGVTSSSAYSVVSGDIFVLSQFIEGYNVSDLGFGSANAKTITLSFWVRSSLTGTFGGSLRNSAADRSYPFSYSISVADTWEQKSVTIVGDTTGTWLTTNGTGLQVNFGLGMGSTYSGTAGAWVASDPLSVTGAVSVVGTNGATFYITGVQLEVGSVATPFERRPYGTELALCQRYYQQFDSADNGSSSSGFSGVCATTAIAIVTGTYLVEMRAAPTVTYNNIQINFGGAGSAITALTSYASKRSLGADVTVTGTPLTIGRAAVMTYTGGASISNRIAFSAEL